MEAAEAVGAGEEERDPVKDGPVVFVRYPGREVETGGGCSGLGLESENRGMGFGPVRPGPEGPPRNRWVAD